MTDFQDNALDRVVNKDFRNPQKNEATINDILDVQAQIENFLNHYLYSSEWVEEETQEMVEQYDAIEDKKIMIPKKVKRGRYRHLPTEDMIIGCRFFGINCDEKNIIPNTDTHYAVDLDIFDGFCIIYQERQDNRIVKLERLQKHMKEKHKKDIELEDLVSSSRDLTWDPMFKNSNGFDKVKNTILMHVSPLVSTTILAEPSSLKSKLGAGFDADMMLQYQSADDALATMQDIIVTGKKYGFSKSSTQIIELQRLMQKLFKLALARSLNGTSLRGIINSIEERKVSITNESLGRQNESGGIFNKVIPRS